MQVPKIQNNGFNKSFQAGIVKLNGIQPQDILQYDAIKEIAEKDKLDISIRKATGTEYARNKHFYTVVATKEMKEFPYTAYGTDCAVIDKCHNPESVSEKIYRAVIRSTERLARNIEDYCLPNPGFLKYLHK